MTKEEFINLFTEYYHRNFTGIYDFIDAVSVLESFLDSKDSFCIQQEWNDD